MTSKSQCYPMRLPLAFVTALFLTSCAYHVHQTRPGFLPGDDFPAAWGNLVNTAQCSNLAGKYDAFGEVSYVFAPPGVYKSNQSHISDVFSVPSKDYWKMYRKRKAWQSFTLSWKGADTAAFFGELGWEFPIKISVSCIDGWLTVRVPKSGAFSEGALREFEATYLVGKVSDGSLAVRIDSIHGTSSFWGAFRTKDSVVYWIKFNAI